MEDRPLISILMGVYNCADTLEEAVQCIREQTYTNWELIICDDCSADDTYMIAKRLREQDQRIKLLKNIKNMTLAPTLNRCLELAQGAFIARMDGDDRCNPQRLEKELNFLQTHDEFVLVSCQMELFDDNGAYGMISHKSEPTKRDLIKRSQFCHAGCMIKTDVLRRLGGYSTDMSYNRVEDYDLWIRLYDAGYLGCNLQETLYSMRDDRNAMRRRNLRNRLNESRLKIRACKQFRASICEYIYVLVPVIKWAIPKELYRLGHIWKNRRFGEMK